jgi:hypothetical protein
MRIQAQQARIPCQPVLKNESLNRGNRNIYIGVGGFGRRQKVRKDRGQSLFLQCGSGFEKTVAGQAWFAGLQLSIVL